jgi:hypothetical protein
MKYPILNLASQRVAGVFGLAYEIIIFSAGRYAIGKIIIAGVPRRCCIIYWIYGHLDIWCKRRYEAVATCRISRVRI